MRFNVVVSATFLCAVTMVTSFSVGPPPYPAVCKEMFPMGHGVDAQFSNPPYVITISMTMYQPYEVVNVTINATEGHSFRGFYLQARRADCRHPDRQKGVGVFDPKTSKIKPMDCLEGTRNAVSHTSRDKKTIVSVLWNAPATDIGHIYFVATVVESRKKFWTNVYSNILRDPSSDRGAQICPSRILLDLTEPTTTTKDPKHERQTNDSGTVSGAMSAMYTMMFVLLVKLDNF